MSLYVIVHTFNWTKSLPKLVQVFSRRNAHEYSSITSSSRSSSITVCLHGYIVQKHDTETSGYSNSLWIWAGRRVAWRRAHPWKHNNLGRGYSARRSHAVCRRGTQQPVQSLWIQIKCTLSHDDVYAWRRLGADCRLLVYMETRKPTHLPMPLLFSILRQIWNDCHIWIRIFSHGQWWISWY